LCSNGGMLDRAACERRVYRLATLLTGNPIAAAKVIERVVDAQPDLQNLDSAHMDRLTVLRSREISPAVIANDHVPMEVAEALAGLTDQQREAWVFARVYGLAEREMAKAMDCSVTATQRHLEKAEETMAARLGKGAGGAATSLREYSMSLDVPEFYRARRRRRRRLRLAAMLILAGAAAAGLIVLARWLF
jgi:hypothetical protein